MEYDETVELDFAEANLGLLSSQLDASPPEPCCAASSERS